ncbi:nicotine blue oxidoreductase [Specibacter sp. RAF43]|uniref:nicotine blue oxidoreductase n=1 Tax=Specibacter sp. RAF43 TaxID=3233057 RepID=UPI003F94843B
MTQTTAVLLAAGAGTRLGRGPKALLPFHGGTLVEHVAQVVRDGGCGRTVVVAGAGAPEVAQLHRAARRLAAPHQPAFAACRLVVNEHWASGMGGSFRTGVAAVAAGDNILVALVDQPGITAALVARLLAAHRPGRITAAGYAGSGTGPGAGLRRGHPIVFSASLAAEAAASAGGDSAARAFLRAHPGLLDVVDCSDLSDGADVDTAEDLHLLAE